MDLRKFRNTGAAHLHLWDEPRETQVMLWPSNLAKLACQTMFTLFLAGNTFAPNAPKYQGKSIQDFLQERYCACFAHLARYIVNRWRGNLPTLTMDSRLRHLDNVMGYEVMNEPHTGYIGLENIGKYPYEKALHLGEFPSPVQGMALGNGHPQRVAVYVRSWPFPTRQSDTRILNTARESVWLNGRQCIWKEHGLWELKESGQKSDGAPAASVLKKDYFLKNPATGQLVEFNRDFYLPFIKRYAETIRGVYEGQKMLILGEPVPNEEPFHVAGEKDAEELGIGKHFVYAPHWYDLATLFSKSFNGIITHNTQQLSKGSRNFFKHTFVGAAGTKKNYAAQISHVIELGHNALREPDGAIPPVIIGECGIPMDMNNHRGFFFSDYALHTLAMDSLMSALETTLIPGFTLWNYNARNDVFSGDTWNGEDFSIFSESVHAKVHMSTNNHLARNQDLSRDQIWYQEATEAIRHRFGSWYIGGRVLPAIIRPYAAKVAGNILLANFNSDTKTYVLQFRSLQKNGGAALHQEGSAAGVTEIFVPDFHFHVASPTGQVSQSGGSENSLDRMERRRNKWIPIALDVKISDGHAEYYPELQTLLYRHDPKVTLHTVSLSLALGENPHYQSFWQAVKSMVLRDQ